MKAVLIMSEVCQLEVFAKKLLKKPESAANLSFIMTRMIQKFLFFTQNSRNNFKDPLQQSNIM